MRLASWLRLFRAAPAPTARRRPTARFRPNLETLESRRVPATLTVSPTGFVGSTPVFSSIQAAINSASPGDTIQVLPGTYFEQVFVNKNNLTLTSTTPLAAIIRGLTTTELAGNKAIVDVSGSGDVVNAFKVAGPNLVTDSGIFFGIYVEGTNHTIQNNRVQDINASPNAGGQFKSGEGIQFGLSPTNASQLGLPVTVGTGSALNNTVTNYQDGGIVIDNTGSTALVQGNNVIGQPSQDYATNGIQVGFGATGTVQSNTVMNNLFTGINGVTQYEATGILLVNPGPGVQVLNNTVIFNDAGIVVSGAVNPVISGNFISLSTYDGIQVYSTTGATISNNTSQFNGQDGIFMQNSNNNTISNNMLNNNSEDGLQLAQSSGNLVQNNMVFGNARYGISQFLLPGQSNTLVGNTVFANGIKNFFP